MRLKKIKIKNFRSYSEQVETSVSNLTTFVGKNDIGKSTILEALDIFFNKTNGKARIKMDKDDVNKACLLDNNKTTEISLIFDDFPARLVIDSTNETSLEAEHLLNSDGDLEIMKKYTNGGSEKVFISANHPTNSNCSDLLLKTQRDLQNIINDENIECENRTKNAVMREAIWSHFSDDLDLEEILIDVTKGETKSIWNKLESYLPLYSLFQSDRKNSDGDVEVQDPLNDAVKQIMSDEEIQSTLDIIARQVEEKLQEVADLTLEKLREMNPEIADSLNPDIPSSESLKWHDVFKKVSITGDEDIPINKRGSGVKRLILLNFFRAEAERRSRERNVPTVIYAIEEPETSQHSAHQKLLVKALIELAGSDNTQILMTTHSPVVVKGLSFENLRLILTRDSNKVIEQELTGQLPYPSLNEVNYTAFEEITEEYHNELYGYLDGEGLLSDFKDGKETMEYIRLNSDGSTQTQDRILTEYIRHQIHHPENTHNVRFTESQLAESISLMRDHIDNQ
ncbi:MAG: ATP/GTP-binding protein [Flavobacteriales bacterium]|nr:ATP/GTP-binding protein [Flavobacteriales bacterium]|tara:strand:+ start:132 stop:1664 length:1533 start_codon:yes stop_codon:yes gene_type:complete